MVSAGALHSANMMSLQLRVLVLVSALPALGWGKTPITHESLWGFKRVTSPAPSPDGKWVVVSVTEPSYNDTEQRTDLWIVPADGSAAPRRLTYTKAAESGVSWSPDSRKIAFSTRRDGDEAAQVYILDVAAGGEAVRVTNLSTGAAGPKWSPNGNSLLFTSRVYPGAKTDEENKKLAAERKGQKYKARVYETFPIRNWDRWMDDLQTHVFVQAAEGGMAKDLLAGTALVSGKGFYGATVSGGDDLEPVWAPDSQSIVFVATTKRHEAAYHDVETHLYQVAVSGGEAKALTSGDASYERPAFSPDGKTLYASRQRMEHTVYALERVVRMDWPGVGTPKMLAPGFDRSANSVAVSADSRTVFVTAEDSGLEKVYAIPAAGGDAKQAFSQEAGCYTGVSIPAKSGSTMLIGLWGSAVSPNEVVRIDPGTGKHQALTKFAAAAAAEIDWLPMRHFTFTSKRGRTIHNMIALPPGFDPAKKYPLFVLIHGGAASMWRDEITLRWNYHLLGAPGYVVLLTNYTGSTGFGEKFARAIQEDPLKGPGEELNEAADEAIKRFPFIDASQQAAGGASYGGHLANWLQATTTRYKCLIAHAGLINLESQWGTSDTIYHREVNAGGPVWEQGKVWKEQNPIRYAKNFRTPILLTVGENDFRVPINQTLENWSVLQRLQIPSKLIVFPEANHWILKPEDSRFFYQEVRAWLGKYLGGS